MAEKTLEEITAILIEEAENKLKTLAGELWEENKGDLKDYARDLARLELKIAMGASSTSIEIARVHLTQITIPCAVQRIKGRVAAELASFFESLLKFLLSLALAWGEKYLNDKLERYV